MLLHDMLIRTLIAFMILFVCTKTLGRKLISHMTFFDFVAGITIGSIVANMMYTDVKIHIGAVGLIIFSLIVLLIDVSSFKHFKIWKWFNGEPELIIKNGKILEAAMKKHRYSVSDLLSQLRKKDVFYVDEVKAAYLETDGNVSILKKDSTRGISQTFILSGQLLHTTLDLLNKDREWVESVLKAHEIATIKNVLLAQIDEQGNIYFDVREDN